MVCLWKFQDHLLYVCKQSLIISCMIKGKVSVRFFLLDIVYFLSPHCSPCFFNLLHFWVTLYHFSYCILTRLSCYTHTLLSCFFFFYIEFLLLILYSANLVNTINPKGSFIYLGMFLDFPKAFVCRFPWVLFQKHIICG